MLKEKKNLHVSLCKHYKGAVSFQEGFKMRHANETHWEKDS